MRSRPLHEHELDADPLRQFGAWYREAEAAAIELPEAVAVATATSDGAPSVRMVLLKGFDERGFVFYSGYESRKGAELAENPRAALLFYWHPLGRQVRIEGSVERVAAEEADALFAASAVAWANLALVLGSVAFVNRSAVVALGAALTLLPAMLAGIARAHPGDAQAYALPGGLYLLAIAHVARSRQPPGRGREIASLATLGVAALLAPGVVQSLDADGVGHALWTAVEGLAVAGWGIATRWRPLAAGGVAAVVAIALRQLFDVVHALPSWILLGGTGLALLAAAVVLLLLRDRLLAAGRAVSDRWSSWD